MEEKKPEKKPEGKLLSKLSPLINLWPAALVAVLVVGMLPTTTPVLQEIPELLSINAEAAKNQESKEQEETEEQAKGNFEDGVYQGTGTGYGGTITVEVTVEGGSIVSVTILSAPGETASFFARAKGVIDSVIQKQTWEVDVVSGATYSSRGILAAIQNAITGEKVETETAPVQETEPLVEEAFEEPEGYQDGTYYGTARGFGGNIQVKVVISEGKITEISIVSASGETPSYLSSAKSVINNILSSQSPNVDTVSGATYSSNGIINAVKSALRQAAGSNASGDLLEEETVASNSNGGSSNSGSKKPVIAAPVVSRDGYVDGTYEGTAEGFGGDITVQVKVSNGKIASITIVSAEDETPSYLSQAEAVIDKMIKAQSPAVDVVSGATYSSTGIINATSQALNKALPSGSEEKPSVPEGTKPAEPAHSNNNNSNSNNNNNNENNENTAKYKDGVYQGEALCDDEDTFTYTVRASVTIKDGAITEIGVEKINDLSEFPEDNDTYLDKAINGSTRSGVWYEGIVNQIVNSQSADGVDVVSRATYSSNAITEAVKNALLQAAAEAPEESSKAEESSSQESSKQEESSSEETPSVEESSAQESSSAEESSSQETPSVDESNNQEGSSADESNNQETPSVEESSSQEDPSDSNASRYADGFYQGEALCEEEDEFTYTIRTNITVSEGVITDVSVEKINDNSEFPEDNDTYLNYAINGRTRKGVVYEGIVDQILNKQGADEIDAVSSATYSSNAIAEAARAALAQASVTPAAASETEKDEISVSDYVVMAWNDFFSDLTERSFRA